MVWRSGLAPANLSRTTSDGRLIPMMNKMIVGNLVHRPVRSLISIVAVALEVTLILLIVGLSLGMVNDQRQRQAGIGADVLVMPPGSSYIVGLTSSPMPVKIGEILANPGRLAAPAGRRVLFKSVGMAVEDLVGARLVWERGRDQAPGARDQPHSGTSGPGA